MFKKKQLKKITKIKLSHEIEIISYKKNQNNLWNLIPNKPNIKLKIKKQNQENNKRKLKVNVNVWQWSNKKCFYKFSRVNNDS
jgi:hypothetical protein